MSNITLTPSQKAAWEKVKEAREKNPSAFVTKILTKTEQVAYYKARNVLIGKSQVKRANSSPKMITLPVPEPVPAAIKVCVFIGSAEDVARAAREFVS